MGWRVSTISFFWAFKSITVKFSVLWSQSDFEEYKRVQMLCSQLKNMKSLLTECVKLYSILMFTFKDTTQVFAHINQTDLTFSIKFELLNISFVLFNSVFGNTWVSHLGIKLESDKDFFWFGDDNKYCSSICHMASL